MWTKVNLVASAIAPEVSAALQELKVNFESSHRILAVLDRQLDAVSNIKSDEDTAELEQSLWPAKILGTKLANFIVPIKAIWAQTLFDEELAQQSLFGTEAKLILNAMNVYYRSAMSPAGLSAPCRVLWYVSRHPALGDVGQIRACSQVFHVDVLSAREAYKRYHRLGTYEWENVLDITKGNPDGRVMAIHFRLTEQFDNPIQYRKVRQIVEECDGKRLVVRGPARLSERAFAALYSRGCRLTRCR